MDMDAIISNHEALELPESFNKWRTDILKKANKLCYGDMALTMLEGDRDMYIKNEDSPFKTFQKSIVRITRHYCDCSEKCTINSLNKIGINPCSSFDKKNLYEDDKYYDNYLIDKRVINNRLVDRNVTNDGEVLRQEIIYYINNLCDGRTGSLRKLKCKAYELKDTCGSNEECLSKLTTDILPPNFRNCKKPEFSDDLTNIGIKIGDPMIFKHVRVSREIPQVYNSVDMVSSSGLLVCIPILVAGIVLTRKMLKSCIAITSVGLTTLKFYFTSSGA